MADIKISGKMKLKTFQSEFCKKFPFLVPTIVNKEGTRLSNDYTIAKSNTLVNGEYSPIKVDDLSINGNLLVGTLEKRFMECFGIPCQVIYRKNGKHLQTGGKYDSLSISEANRTLESENAEKIVLTDITSYA
jgi:hypothetical protein